MASSISPLELTKAYQVFGITEAELLSIETSPYKESEELLKKMKAKARKAYKSLIRSLHPDHNGGDQEKTALFDLLTRSIKEIGKRVPKSAALYEAETRIVNITVQSAKPSMQVNIRKVAGSRKTGFSSTASREAAARLSKMRPGS